MLEAARHGAADAEEVWATCARIEDGEPDSWLAQWTATAGAAWAVAVTEPRTGIVPGRSRDTSVPQATTPPHCS